LLEEGFLKKKNIDFFEDESSPAPKPGYIVMCHAWIKRGLSLPPSKFFSEVLDKYGLQPHNICPNSFTVLSNFQTLCEGHLGVETDIKLFQWFYRIRPEDDSEKNICNCDSVTFILRARRNFPTLASHEYVRYWNREWFYHKNLSSKDQANKLLEFKDEAAKETPFWKE
jgi:hypothetical protein